MTRTPLLALPSCLFATALFLGGCGGSSNNPPPPPVVKSDPLYEHQWYLKNTGQAAFSSEGGVPGIDLNVESLFNAGNWGGGVKVLVLDDGLDIRHPDLAPNVDSARLRNFDANAKDPADPTPTAAGDAHGTAVAGIIAAAAHNDIGGRGIAPLASLGAGNLLACGDWCEDNQTQATIEAYGGAPFSADTWVINASYGSDPTAPDSSDLDVGAAPIANFANLRGGKGIVMVKSAGNAFGSFDVPGPDGRPVDSGQCGPANQHDLSCQNAAFDLESAMPQVVTVGAVNAHGVKSSYSTAGSSLLVAGLGGEFGSAKPGSPATAGPALVTTDLAGCERGYARRDREEWQYANDFDKPGTDTNSKFNPQCDYTAAMNGTSAAAPTVTGVVALMLAANPDLTWRDLRLILTRTARKIDAGRAPVTLQLDGGAYIAQDGWTKNGAGLWFHNWYGYGLVDAAAAVAMAKTTISHLTGPMADSGWIDSEAAPSLPVPQDDPAGAVSKITFANPRTIEAVQVGVTIDGDARLGDLGIELVSPAGTRSVLMNAHNAFQKSTTAIKLTLMSNAFNEEKANGDWTLRVVDVNGREDAGRQALLRDWSLRVHGR
ncbi:MAG: S8 family serine peptidase [Burkholderiaceae bacterium]